MSTAVPPPSGDDPSNGFDAVAPEYLAQRGVEGGTNGGGVGTAIVRAWAAGLPPGATVLDLGCGPGVPVTLALVEAGLRPWGVDASPRMVAAFRARFPALPVECAPAETAHFLDHRFDAIVAWGLLFLLQPEAQALVLARAARALVPGGRLLFTAPWQACAWRDLQTGRLSRSLGAEAYARLLAEHGLRLLGTATDEGENHYWLARAP